jgi:hypothetical protein
MAEQKTAPTLEIIPTPLVNVAFKEEFDWKTVIGMLWRDDILKVCSKKDVRGNNCGLKMNANR